MKTIPTKGLTAFLYLFVYLTLTQVSFGQFSNVNSSSQSQIDNIVSQYQNSEQIVGMSVGIIKDGEIVYLKGYGLQDREMQIPATEETLFRIASVSKPITGLLSMILLEQGKLDLNKDIRDYVPEYPIKSQGTITSEDLLSNESGIIHYAGTSSGQYCSEGYNTTYRASYSDLFTDRYDPVEALGIFKDQQICFTPGQHYQYTTWGFCLMGAVLERAYGDEFEDLVYKELVYSLELPRFQPEFRAFEYDNETKGYEIISGSVLETNPGYFDYENISYKIPGGGFVATAADMALIVKSIVNAEVIPQDKVDLFGTRHIPADGNGRNYGYGIFNQNSGGNRIYNHGGSQAKAESVIYFSPDTKDGVVILTNTRGAYLWNMANAIYNAIPSLITENNTYTPPSRNLVKVANERTVTICDGESYEGYTEAGVYITNSTDNQGRQVKDVLILEVSPCSMVYDENLDFGSLETFYPQTMTFSIGNETESVQTVTISNIPPEVSLDKTSFTLQPGESIEIQATIVVNSVGTFSSSLDLEFSDSQNDSINIFADVGCYVNRGSFLNFDESSLDNWLSWDNWPLSVEEGRLKAEVNKGSNWDAIVLQMDETNLSKTPAVSISFEATANLDIRMDLVDVDGKVTSAEPVVFAYNTSQGNRPLFFNFDGKFRMWPDNSQVDATRIKEIWIIPQPGNSFQGTLYIDDIHIGNGVNEIVHEVEIAACGESFQFGDQTLTESGEYSARLQSSVGCDSLTNLTLHLAPEFNETASGSILTGDFVSFGSQTLISSGEYIETFLSQASCDSTVTYTLEVIPTTVSAEICEGDVYILGSQNLTTSGSFSEIFTSRFGYDSTVNLELAVNPEYLENETRYLCEGESYQFGDQTLTDPGSYSELFQTALGCDSTVQLTLLKEAIIPEVTLSGEMLVGSIEEGATYQWLNCNSNFEPVPGATSATFSPRVSGSYALEVTRNNCSFISTCTSVTVIILGSDESLADMIGVYPNPSYDGQFVVEFHRTFTGFASIRDLTGKMISNEELNGVDTWNAIIDQESGVYLLTLIDQKGQKTSVRVIVKN